MMIPKSTSTYFADSSTTIRLRATFRGMFTILTLPSILTVGCLLIGSLQAYGHTHRKENLLIFPDCRNRVLNDDKSY